MKIAFLCLAMYAYVVYASEESERDPVAQHAEHDNQQDGYIPYTQAYGPQFQPQPWSQPQPPPQQWPQPWPQPQRVTPRRNSFLNIDPIMLYFLINALRPTTTTTPATTITTTVTQNPLAGWTRVDDCYYLLSSTTASWDAADNECKGAIDEGRLAVVGFSQALDDREDLMNDVGATGTTFWIGAKGQAVDTTDVDNTQFIAPLEASDPNSGDSTFDIELFDGASVTDDEVVCGRVDAEDANNLLFEECNDKGRRYMCEVCP